MAAHASLVRLAYLWHWASQCRAKAKALAPWSPRSDGSGAASWVTGCWAILHGISRARLGLKKEIVQERIDRGVVTWPPP